jgi:hypothetical protein
MESCRNPVPTGMDLEERFRDFYRLLHQPSAACDSRLGAAFDAVLSLPPPDQASRWITKAAQLLPHLWLFSRQNPAATNLVRILTAILVHRATYAGREEEIRFAVIDFAYYAGYADDPAAFGLNTETLPTHWTGLAYERARLQAGHFASELDFLRWKLKQPGCRYRLSFKNRWVHNKQAVRAITRRIRQLRLEGRPSVYFPV